MLKLQSSDYQLWLPHYLLQSHKQQSITERHQKVEKRTESLRARSSC